MKRERGVVAALGLALLVSATGAESAVLDVEVWTDRGNDAVYQPGDVMEVRVRSSMDAYLLVYEVDSEGRVNLLFPERGSRGFVEGRATVRVPSEQSNLDLVVEGSAGEGFVVAIASSEPFKDLPWYLRPVDMQATELGYQGAPPTAEEGVTSDGKIVGDPFVAMERIRRNVVATPDDASRFATAYTTYYIHHQVKYPRYLCNDCHRPGYWAWWDGFDPYYAHCSVFDFRVNWYWGWGPGYWFGYVPYYYYVYRPDCPPRYRVFSSRYCSSWDGYATRSGQWGGDLRRYKSDPPAGYIPPSGYKDRTTSRPPGFISNRTVARGRHSGSGGIVPVRRGEGGTSETPQRVARSLRDPGTSPRGGDQGRQSAPRIVTRGETGRSSTPSSGSWRSPGSNRTAKPQGTRSGTQSGTRGGSSRPGRSASPAPRVRSQNEQGSIPVPRSETPPAEPRADATPWYEWWREGPRSEKASPVESRGQEQRVEPVTRFEYRPPEQRPEPPKVDSRREEPRPEPQRVETRREEPRPPAPAPSVEPKREERRAEPTRDPGLREKSTGRSPRGRNGTS